MASPDTVQSEPPPYYIHSPVSPSEPIGGPQKVQAAQRVDRLVTKICTSHLLLQVPQKEKCKILNIYPKKYDYSNYYS